MRVTKHQASILQEQLPRVDALAAEIENSQRLELLPVLRREVRLAFDVIRPKESAPDPLTLRAAARVHVNRFVDECCDLDPGSSIDAGTFFTAFGEWFRKNMPEASPISQKQVGRVLKERFRCLKRGKYIYYGISLKESSQEKNTEKQDVIE